MNTYTIFTLHETTNAGDLIWQVADRVKGKPSEQELKKYGGIKQTAIIDGVEDVQELLENLNKHARKYNARAEVITKISEIIKDYAGFYAEFFENHFNEFEYKNDGTLYKKWDDKFKSLPKPANSHYFSCDHKGWLKVSVWGGYEVGYIEDSVMIYNVHTCESVERNNGYFNSSYRPVKPIDVHNAEIEIQSREESIAWMKSEISKIKNRMGW